MFELAGFVGVDPRSFTFRQLAAMARGRAARLWDHTASTLAMIANVNRDPKKNRRGFAPIMFHPFEKKKRRRAMSPAGLRSLKGMFKK